MTALETAVAMVSPENLSLPSRKIDLNTVEIGRLRRDFSTFRIETNTRFDSMDKRFDGIDQRLDGIDGQLSGINALLVRIAAKMDLN